MKARRTCESERAKEPEQRSLFLAWALCSHQHQLSYIGNLCWKQAPWVGLSDAK
jgi:hypothetical protein